MRQRIWLAAATLCAVAHSGIASAAFSGLYVFGDSLSDTGNVETRYETLPVIPGVPQVPAPVTDVIGGPGYYNGRASNGPLYVDFLSQGLGLSTAPQLDAWLDGGTNYAFGGARTHYQIYDPTRTQYLGLLQQTDAYLAAHPNADPAALYTVWGGSNNVQDIIRGEDAFGNPPQSIEQTVADLRSILLDLHAAGAREFLVPNVPDLALVPRVNQLGPQAEAAAAQLTVQFNALLDALLDDLAFEVHRLDVYTLFNDLIANAADQGFTNTTDPCFTGDDLTFTGGGSVCANPEQYIFWDTIHPTWQVHRILADAALGLLQVPEPPALALLAIALVALRR